MIVRNEAHQLAEALTNFSSFADEIIVVDTGSTDDTRILAQQYATRVFDFPWCDDFSAARNVSFSKASGDYILWLDADDRIEGENQEKIGRLKDYFDGKTAFYFTVQGEDSTGSSCSLYQLRCLPNRKDLRFQGRVHERIDHAARKCGLRLGTVDIVIHHCGYLNRDVFAKKVQRNLALLEKELEEGRDDEQIQFYLALSYDHLGMEERAKESMKKALFHMEIITGELTAEIRQDIDFSPFILEAHLFLARLCLKTKDDAEALRHLTKANALAESNAEDAQSFFRLGTFYQRIHKHGQAMSCLMKAIAGKGATGYVPLPPPPPQKKILIDMAYSFMCLNQTDQAMACMQSAWEMGLDVCESWEQLGLTALTDGEMKLALQAYDAAYHTGALSDDGYCNLAHLHLRLNKLKSAKLLFQHLLSTGHKDIDVLLALARLHAFEKEWDEFNRIRSLIEKVYGPVAPNSASTHETFFTHFAGQLESRKKPKLAQWAREIARIVGR